jgi:hypothetical protein
VNSALFSYNIGHRRETFAVCKALQVILAINATECEP